MKKKDLKSGMWVELRSGDRCLVLTNCNECAQFHIVDNEEWDDSTNFDDDLCNIRYKHLDIMKVFSDEISSETLKGAYTLIWERSSHENDVEATIQKLQEQIDKLKEELKK